MEYCWVVTLVASPYPAFLAPVVSYLARGQASIHGEANDAAGVGRGVVHGIELCLGRVRIPLITWEHEEAKGAKDV